MQDSFKTIKDSLEYGGLAELWDWDSAVISTYWGECNYNGLIISVSCGMDKMFLSPYTYTEPLLKSNSIRAAFEPKSFGVKRCDILRTRDAIETDINSAKGRNTDAFEDEDIAIYNEDVKNLKWELNNTIKAEMVVKPLCQTDSKILKKCAWILVEAEYACAYQAIKLPAGGVISWGVLGDNIFYEDVDEEVNPFKNTLIGRQQLDSIENWLYLKNPLYKNNKSLIISSEDIFLFSNNEEGFRKNRHDWRSERIFWCIEELCKEDGGLILVTDESKRTADKICNLIDLVDESYKDNSYETYSYCIDDDGPYTDTECEAFGR